MWSVARSSEDAEVIAMSLELYREDPSDREVPRDHMSATLTSFRAHPVRGRAVVFRDGLELAGYALLVSFWSNELGGEICTVDELYVKPAFRGKGLATRIMNQIKTDRALWPAEPVAIALEVTPTNSRARALYEKLGFKPMKNASMRLRF